VEKYLLCPQPSVLYDLKGYGPQTETIISHRQRILSELTLYIQFRLNYKIAGVSQQYVQKPKRCGNTSLIVRVEKLLFRQNSNAVLCTKKIRWAKCVRRQLN
jgi:hypothetical protein